MNGFRDTIGNPLRNPEKIELKKAAGSNNIVVASKTSCEHK
jgi:hypothetical protein